MAVVFIFLSSSLCAQVLENKITIKEEKVELGQVLKKLKQNFGIKLSYANNVIPEKRIISIDVKEARVKEVLDKLFVGTNVSYQVIGDQVVLKNEKKKEQKKNIEKSIKKDSSRTEVPKQNPEPRVEVSLNKEQIILDDSSKKYPVTKINAPRKPTRQELNRAYRLERKRLKYEYLLRKDSLLRMENNPKTSNQQKWNEVIQDLKREIKEIRDSIHNKTYKLFPELKKDSVRTVNDTSALALSKDSAFYETQLAQITFISPIGTNGSRCGSIVNIFSFNFLGGYAAGLKGFEFGGLVNVEKDYVYGIQFVGFSNVVKNWVHGGQFSGFTNIAGKNVKGGQFSGFANIAGDSLIGAQVAGFCNITRGTVKGLQTSGFCNVTTGDFKGCQLSFINISAGKHSGFQAGFINYARILKGSQVGFINISDSANGAPVGFLSIVRHGYRRVELYGAESMYGNIAFKTGVRSFYNILYTGAEVNSNYYRWAFGYGFGTEHAFSKRVNLGLDLISMHVNENQTFTAKLNLLNQARLNLGVALSPSVSLFIGPTFNVMVSQYVNPDYSFGSKLARGQLYNKTTGSVPTNVKMWIGFNGGLRF